MSIEYKERDFASFFKVKDAYADNVHYVSPLKDDLKRMLSEKKNPFFKRGALTYFTALKNNRPVGRIVAHVFHAANQKFNERRGYFGFFDCIDDEEVAQGLLGRAEAFVKSHQCDHISGNFNLNAMQEMGVLIEGDEKPPMLDMLYGPVYLSKLLEAAGYQQEFLMRTSTNERMDTFDVDSVLRDKHKALKASGEFEFRHLRLKEYDQEVQRIRKVLNASMANNPFFVDITEEEMDFQLGPFKAVLDPKLVRIAEKDGEVVAASLSAPDFNPLLKKMKSTIFPFGWFHFLTQRKKIRDAVMILIVVDPRFHGKGVIGVLNHELLCAFKEGGYKRVGGTWIADVNKASLRQMEYLEMKTYFRMALYTKTLT